VSLFRRTPPKPPREPYPDARVEARLQHVLALYRRARLTEARLADIGAQQEACDDNRQSVAYHGNRGYKDQAAVLAEHSEDLRCERTVLEQSLSSAHEEIAKILADLGDHASYLGPLE